MKRVHRVGIVALLALLMTISLLLITASAEEQTANFEFTTTDTANDTLVFTGPGVIDRDELKLDDSFDQYKNGIKYVKIDETVTGITDYGSSDSFISNDGVTITIEGEGVFRFGNNACRGMNNLSVFAPGGRILEIGDNAFNGAKLLDFPKDISTVGSSGMTNAQLPGIDTLELHLHGVSIDSVDELTSTCSFMIASGGLSLKNEKGDRFQHIVLHISDTYIVGNLDRDQPVFGANTSADQYETYTFILEDDARALFGREFGAQSATTVKFEGTGELYFENPTGDYVFGRPFGRATQLETLDFSNFSGTILFGKNMMGTRGNSTLKSVIFGEECYVTKVSEEAFADCESLSTFDFSKIHGAIEARAFENTKLTEVDLSNVTAIYEDAFEGLPDTATGWNSIETAIENRTLKKLEYNEVFKDNETVHAFVKELLAGKFSLESLEENYDALKPSDEDWEDWHAGDQNGTAIGSTQLTKAAKWTDTDRTEAEVELQFSYAPVQQMDFIFVLDGSTSMRASVNEEAKGSKFYEMLSKTADVVGELLESDVDCQVGVISFGDEVNYPDIGDLIGQGYQSYIFNKGEEERAISTIMQLPSLGKTDYSAGLEVAYRSIMARFQNRNVTVVFLSDGEPNENVDNNASIAEDIQDAGAQILGVLYKATEDVAAEAAMQKVCQEFYFAQDTKGFSEAINRIIYDSLHNHVLTDTISEYFELPVDTNGQVAENAITVTGGSYTIGDDQETITWDLSDTEPYTTYTMRIQLDLCKDKNGAYPIGVLPTNAADAPLNEPGVETPVNQVASPELKRGDAWVNSGDLTVSKTVDGNAGEKNRNWTFTVTLDDTSINGTFGKMVFVNGVATFKLRHGQHITAENLPSDVFYTVVETEANQNGYKTSSTGETGTIVKDETAVASFTNTKQSAPPDDDEDDEPKPPVIDPDKPHYTPDGLNTEDHVAYIIGYDDGEVKPQNNITRAEVATIFFRLLTDETRERYWSQSNDYTDVPFDAWFNNAISTLSNVGIIDGYPDGSFRPNASITRAEFTKIAVSFFTYADEHFDNPFTDVPENAWYTKFVTAAVEIGLVEGYPDGTFRPNAPITRAEACTIVNRTLGRAPDKDHLLPIPVMITWPDNLPSAWYYAQMQEATNSHDYVWIGAIEDWTAKLEERDWVKFEKEWSTAYSAPGGEVMH